MIDLEAIRKRCDAATPGPWKCNPTSTVSRQEDAEFIAYSRTYLPATLDEIEWLKRKLKISNEMAATAFVSGFNSGYEKIDRLTRERDDAKADRDRYKARAEALQRDLYQALRRVEALERAARECEPCGSCVHKHIDADKNPCSGCTYNLHGDYPNHWQFDQARFSEKT
jgi:hypothetical protein